MVALIIAACWILTAFCWFCLAVFAVPVAFPQIVGKKDVKYEEE